MIRPLALDDREARILRTALETEETRLVNSGAYADRKPEGDSPASRLNTVRDLRIRLTILVEGDDR